MAAAHLQTPVPDAELVRRYEEQLDPAQPTAGDIDVTVIGYGEVSAVLKFGACPGLVFKRLACFETEAETARFSSVIDDYCACLAERGVAVAPTVCHMVQTARNGTALYLVQPAMDPHTIGNALLRDAGDDELRALIRAILHRLNAAFTPNGDSTLQLGMDSQISNWAWVRDGDEEPYPLYLDNGAPFIRRNGVELLEFEVFGRIFPQPIRWYFRKFELQGVLDRFHSIDGVMIDIAGNFIKEGRAERIPLLLEEMQAWRDGPAAHLNVTVPTVEEVEKFYAADAWIWTYILSARKIDRFLTTRVLQRRYPHILPGKIVRR